MTQTWTSRFCIELLWKSPEADLGLPLWVWGGGFRANAWPNLGLFEESSAMFGLPEEAIPKAGLVGEVRGVCSGVGVKVMGVIFVPS